MKYGLMSANKSPGLGATSPLQPNAQTTRLLSKTIVCLLLPLSFFKVTVPAATVVFVQLSIQRMSHFPDVFGLESLEHE